MRRAAQRADPIKLWKESGDFCIVKKQLEYLAERVKKLQRLTNKICKAKIEFFEWIESKNI